MNRFCLHFILAIAALTLFAGCSGKDSPKLSTSEKNVFDQAPPEVSQMWKSILDADKNNDYVGANRTLYNLSRLDLTPEQSQAVSTELESLKQRLADAVKRGDPEAIKALEELRRGSGRRQKQ